MQLIYSTHSTSLLKGMPSLPIILLNCRHSSRDLQCVMLVAANVALSGQCQAELSIGLQRSNFFLTSNHRIILFSNLLTKASCITGGNQQLPLDPQNASHNFFFTIQVFPNQVNLVHSKISNEKGVLLSFSYVSLLEYITLLLPFICCPFKKYFFNN